MRKRCQSKSHILWTITIGIFSAILILGVSGSTLTGIPALHEKKAYGQTPQGGGDDDSPDDTGDGQTPQGGGDDDSPDDTGDGFPSANPPNCAGPEQTPPSANLPNCAEDCDNLIDDDSDGYIDGADIDCSVRQSITPQQGFSGMDDLNTNEGLQGFSGMETPANPQGAEQREDSGDNGDGDEE